MRKTLFIAVIGLAMLAYFSRSVSPTAPVEKIKGKFIIENPPFSQNERSLDEINVKMRAYASKKFDEMSPTEREDLIKLNRARVFLVKRRLDEKIKRIKI